MRRKHLFWAVVYVFVFFFSINLFSAPPKNRQAEEVVKKIDELYRSRSSVGSMEMHITTPHWKRTLKMKIWTQGMEKTFIRILEPKKEKGTATLRIGDEMWNYLPKTNKVIKIPSSMMMSSWMGSDFTNDDLVNEFTFFEDYDFEFTEVEDPKPGTLYIRCTPHQGLPIVWGSTVVAVREEDSIPLWEKYYDEKGKLMRKMIFKKVKTFDDRKIPSVIELIPMNEEGHKTIVRYLEIEFNVRLDEDVFTLRNLRSRI